MLRPSSAALGSKKGFTKELELHGVGFRCRVEPRESAAPPPGEVAKAYRLGTQKYGESPFHKQAGPVELPDLSRAGVLVGGAGGGFRHKRHPLRPLSSSLAPGGTMLAMLPGITEGKYRRPGYGPKLQDREHGLGTQTLMMRIGFTHEVRVDFPPHLEVSCPTPTTLIISGIDRQQVGLAASRVRLLRKPDPYKGKGIRYAGEVVKLRPGKKK
jgi:ribosomal protein L6P/L9E